ncbi:hypothetical protein M885DRAFT_524368 [Pelagophyceae sp. CCMP2097]|nr:hypothetical protein M885DRAFT_524368 [Pelagophyceae sp. CCMP2097]|mmetsp:Transcript_12833/g.44397  ORF Transcript_12833/g.44397 Transcript_12833/m.44397 type:complete len:155 (-) Transcript_12833:26-490(-)
MWALTRTTVALALVAGVEALVSPRAVGSLRRRLALNAELFVAKLAYETTEADLVDAFEAVCDVQHVMLPLGKKTKLGRGFAFVTVHDDDADKAIAELHGSSVRGAQISVEVNTRPVPPTKQEMRTLNYRRAVKRQGDERYGRFVPSDEIFDAFG